MNDDLSGTPRPTSDIVEALRCIETEIVQNPLAMSKQHGPLVIHYIVIRDALIELLAVRAKK